MNSLLEEGTRQGDSPVHVYDGVDCSKYESDVHRVGLFGSIV